MPWLLLLIAACEWPSHVYEPFNDTGLWRPAGAQTTEASDTSTTGSHTSAYSTSAELVVVRTFPCLNPAERDARGAFLEPVVLSSAPVEAAVKTFGSVVMDFDGDGWDDVWFAADDGGAIYLFDGVGFTYDDESSVWGASDISTARGGAVVDYDADGDLDLFVVRDGAPDRLFRNDGDGAWEDVTGALFKVQDSAASRAALWTDSDSDGDMDLWVVNDGVGDTPRLYRNNDGVFDLEDMTAVVEDLDSFRDVGELHAMDVTGDGQVELFTWHVSAPSGHFGRLWTRGSNGRWWPSVDPVARVRAAHTVVPRQFDGSAGVDWIVGGNQGLWGLESTSKKAQQWTNVLVYGWGIMDPGLDGVAVTGAYAGDFNHDGVQDLLLDKEPLSFGLDGLRQYEDRLYLGGSAGLEGDQATSFGLDTLALGVGGGLVDLNQDGWLDVVRRNTTGSNTVHLSRCGAAPSLQVRLSWSGLNPNAIGAKVTLFLNDGFEVRWMQSFGPAGSSHPPVVHFGLGEEAPEDQRLQVTWPDGEISTHPMDSVGGLASTSHEVVIYRTD